MFDHASRNNLADYIVAYYVSVTRAILVERCHIVYARRWRNVGHFATRNLVSPSAKGKQKKEKQINLRNSLLGYPYISWNLFRVESVHGTYPVHAILI